jgi:hypothetical protein
MEHSNMRMPFPTGSSRLPGLIVAGLAVVISSGPALRGQAPHTPAPPKPAPAAQAPPKTAPATPAAKPPSNAATSTLPSARSIIDKHLAAIGGRAAVLSHTSSHANGSMTMSGSGITGVVEIYAAKPNKSLVKINLGGIGEIVEGFDGVNAWSISPITGPSLTQGKELEDKKFDADFYSDLHEQGRYASMKTIEKTTFDGRPCYKVSLVRTNGTEDFDFYDVATGLKAGAMVTRESQMGPMSVTQITSDYKNFAGLLLPTTLKQTAMGVEQVLKLTAIEFDNVPPTTFDPPAQIKALLK